MKTVYRLGEDRLGKVTSVTGAAAVIIFFTILAVPALHWVEILILSTTGLALGLLLNRLLGRMDLSVDPSEG